VSVVVRRAAGPAEDAEARALVEAVFAGEQGVRAPLEEAGELRLVAVDASGAVLGSCRLSVEGDVARLGSLVVARPARRQGHATALLTEAERESRAAGATRIRLNAQVAARPLYERAGYAPRGGTFLAEGIEHVAMEKDLADG
jgi:predicted GNAT family N-acyltransferase